MSLWTKHITKQLSAYVHGELDKIRDDEVRAHLDECRRCQDEFEVIRDGVRLASQLQCVEAPNAILQEIENRLAEPGKGPQSGERSFWWQRMPALPPNISSVPAIAVLAIITAVALMYFLRPEEKSKAVWDLSP